MFAFVQKITDDILRFVSLKKNEIFAPIFEILLL